MTKTPALSLIIPTRERAAYLGSAIKTCTDNAAQDLEILVLDNASTDDTSRVMSGIADPRVRYMRNSERLSMRDNFEKGINESRGAVIGFIGDDDGVMPDAVDTVLKLFGSHDVDAVSAARAHYFWPDLLSSRRDTALLPRGRGVVTLDARSELRRVLTDNDYYRLPCLYHGFVRRSVVERISRRQGRFFLSSQVDMFSSIALSMEGLRYAFSYSPLVINGGSSRSNGASHFGGGASAEKNLWKKEDDLGFLPGFEGCLTVGALIVESAVRYGQANGISDVTQILADEDVRMALAAEAVARGAAGAPVERSRQMYSTAGIPAGALLESGNRKGEGIAKLSRMLRAFGKSMPLDMAARHITDVHAAAQHMHALHAAHRTAIWHGAREQVSTALKISRKNPAD
jgi:glycosyltransferase involved in cell wall biosynthesis